MDTDTLGSIIFMAVGGVLGFMVLVTLFCWIISVGVAWGIEKDRKEKEKKESSK